MYIADGRAQFLQRKTIEFSKIFRCLTTCFNVTLATELLPHVIAEDVSYLKNQFGSCIFKKILETPLLVGGARHG